MPGVCTSIFSGTFGVDGADTTNSTRVESLDVYTTVNIYVSKQTERACTMSNASSQMHVRVNVK